MGQQAGGASVHYHILSPLSRGLFNHAISLSGSALCWWASLKRPLEKVKKMARYIICNTYSSRNTYIIVVDSYLFLPPRIGSCVIQINKMFRFFQTNQMSISKER